jgi:hypothetical protein
VLQRLGIGRCRRHSHDHHETLHETVGREHHRHRDAQSLRLIEKIRIDAVAGSADVLDDERVCIVRDDK